MTETFTLRLDEIQPSQLYISKLKLSRVEDLLSSGKIDCIQPIPIKRLRGFLMATDGHTRGVAWYRRGHKEVECCWEDMELDWRAYSICIDWCLEEGITSMEDLTDHIIDHEDFKILWLERCRVMQEELTGTASQDAPDRPP
ncbi:hypothetical protein EU520_00840 [Candidatus Thorarchaeota archaeon]|nr:MAG: hypothetical protein EU520_00840 [Candidatus Thorarchaeota archaeon]